MEVLEERNYVVYKHTSPSGKSYVGLTNNYIKRCNQHKHKNSYCRLFYKAIIKYGWDNLTHEILEENLTLQEANDKEKYYIEYYNSLSPNGYNLTTGGKAYELAEEVKKSRRRAYRGSNTGHANIMKIGKTYRVNYEIAGVITRLGMYNTLEEAIIARDLGIRTSAANVSGQVNRGVMRPNNKLGELNISMNYGKYRVKINDEVLGLYNTLEEAIIARDLKTKTSSALSKTSNTGITGIYLRKGKYDVKITVEGKFKNIGVYNTLDEAIEAKSLGYKTSCAVKHETNTGIVGISQKNNSYEVTVKGVYLGSYNTLEDAIEAKSLNIRTDKAKVGSRTKRTQQST